MSSTTRVAQPLRKKRFGSDTAGHWARNLRLRVGRDRGGRWVWLNTGIPAAGAKAVLLALCNYVDEIGQCWPSIETLADDTDQSAASARRRLADLEAIGVLSRFARIRDENGAIHVSPIARGVGEHDDVARGRQTSDLIRLNFGISQGEIDEALFERVTDDDDGDDGDDGEPISPTNLQGLTEEISPTNLQGQGYHSCDPQNPEPPSEPSPQAPQEGGCEASRFEEFRKIWEGDGVPIARPSLVKPPLRSLSEDEVRRLLRAAKGYLHHRSREKKPGAKLSAQNFIREIDAWPGWEKLAPPEPVARTAWPRGSDAYRAGAAMRMLAFGAPVREDVWSGPAEIPPRYLALARFADPDGRVDRSGWIALDATAHVEQIAAWRHFVRDCVGRWIELEQVPVIDPETGQPKVNIQTWNGKELRFPVKREVLRVPFDWPPRKDGSISQGHSPPEETSAA
jgi:hypothetical protein